MQLSIPDDILAEAGLTGPEAIVEFACRLYDAGRLSKRSAGRLCGLDRAAFELQLHTRGLSVYRTTMEDYDLDRGSDAQGIRRAG